MPFPCSVKETLACPTGDISLTLSSAGDMQGYFWRSSGTFHCSSSWNDPERPRTTVVLPVQSFARVTWLPYPPFLWSLCWDWLMHFDPGWECYCNRGTSPPCKSFTFTQDYKALFKAQPFWESNISAVTCNKMTSSCSGKGCNKVCWWVVSGIWPS